MHEYPRRVSVSQKNPNGVTIVDEHLRRLPGTYLDPNEMEAIFYKANLKNIKYPTSKKITEFKNADKYDDLIAFWTDYFNKKLNIDPRLDPNVIKALIESESGFRLDPPENKLAFGISQITRETHKILQDPHGEVKEFIFNKIRQKYLKRAEISIPLSIRWIAYKQSIATVKLGRTPTHEEIILEYKGLLKSKTNYKNNALEKYRINYELLKKL